MSEGSSDDAGIMADLTIQFCDKIVERMWLKVMSETPMEIDEILKSTMIVANCVSIVTTVIDNADDLMDDSDDDSDDEELEEMDDGED
jgi:phosphopantothenoylcysteine synthetase/decarboxylase